MRKLLLTLAVLCGTVSAWAETSLRISDGLLELAMVYSLHKKMVSTSGLLQLWQLLLKVNLTKFVLLS